MSTDTSASDPALEIHREPIQDAEKRVQALLERIQCLEKDQASQLINLKYELSKDILEQANAPITRATQALAFIISVLVVAGSALTYFISSNLQTTFETQMKQRVESWLSLESESSIASKTLDAYRTRALLDSYMIQLARRKARGESMVNLDFKKGDQNRLLTIIESRDADNADFFDALKLLSVARGGWAFGARNDSVSQRLRALFLDADFDINRKLYILEIMDRDEGLKPVAIGILKTAEQPQPFRFQAFKMLQNERLNSEGGALAHRYALEQLDAAQEPDHTLAVVQYLAKVDPFNPALTVFLQQLEKQPRAARITLRTAIAAGWISLLPHPSFQLIGDLDAANPPTDRVKLRRMIAENLSLAMADGLGLGVLESISAKPGLFLQFTHTSGSVAQVEFPLERLFEDTQLLSVLFKLEQAKGLDTFARFFNTVHRDEVVTSLRMVLPVEAFEPTQRQALVEQVEVSLKVSPQGTAFYRWTDKNGDMHQQPLSGALEPKSIKVIYERDYLIFRALDDGWMF
ncbi:hypothetical protein [Pseudomonas fluorescens]|uniref:Uncharacterized protein n=1 Tax=Pseudomonas fluorescens TaxID=294 RepID=A0AAE2U205_PSEFL|nr:hypothetical protein [Pseudomonas fluorescens]MBD8270231.1 hypothetical protein [Pseudomonas fluorescens]